MYSTQGMTFPTTCWIREIWIVVTSFLGWIRHVWTIHNPPEPVKTFDAIRMGILGAGWIADLSLFPPAKSHPEVIIAAVAARDPKRAAVYAKKNRIPIVHKSYQDLLDDPSIDAVYIPLPNSLHYEWASRALRAGKHVLLEKPFTSNATEAQALFAFHASILPCPTTSGLAASQPPVLLEAFHFKFHPAWHAFLSLLSPDSIERVDSSMSMLAGFFKKDDIRFRYDLAGGSLMDIGSYNVLTLREVFRAEPVECLAAESRIRPLRRRNDRQCDEAFKATFRFPNGGIGTICSDNYKTGCWGLPSVQLPKVVVRHKEALVLDHGADATAGLGERHGKTRTVTMWLFPGPHYWHSIGIVDEHIVRNGESGKNVVRSWIERESKKAYVWSEEAKREGEERGMVRNGEECWSTYRHLLEQFVNKVKGRPGSGLWIDGEDSIKNMKMIDMAYEKAGMAIRPTSPYEER